MLEFPYDLFPLTNWSLENGKILKFLWGLSFFVYEMGTS